MKIIAFNGSPHGNDGNTIFAFQYIKKYFPDTECITYNIALQLKKIENDENYFNSIIKEVESAEAIIWVFPVYIFLLPSQMKRFIELLWERDGEGAFQDKYATSIITSIHFCDDFPMNYIHGVSEDLGMKYVTGYSIHMNDMDIKDKRKGMSLFSKYFFEIVKNRIPVPKIYAPITYKPIEYHPENIQEVSKQLNYKMLLLTDAEEKDRNLLRMIETFTKLMPNPIEIVNLHDINIVSGCIGCGNCQYNFGECRFANKDEYEQKIQSKIQDVDALILAPKIKDRYFSAKWKQMEDRRFVDNHRPLWNGKQVLYLISGPLRSLPNLLQLLITRKQINEAEIASIVTDEYELSKEITDLIKGSIDTLLWSLDNKFSYPYTFIGIGAKKLFRDFVWDFQWAFPGDHDYYKDHGFYDFPKKHRFRNRVLNFILKHEKTRNWFGKKFSSKIKKQRESILNEVLI